MRRRTLQVDMEIACGAVNTRRLEDALRNAEFEPDGEREWRWVADGPGPKSVVKFELLADLDDQPAQVTISRPAINLPGSNSTTTETAPATRPRCSQLADPGPSPVLSPICSALEGRRFLDSDGRAAQPTATPTPAGRSPATCSTNPPDRHRRRGRPVRLEFGRSRKEGALQPTRRRRLSGIHGSRHQAMKELSAERGGTMQCCSRSTAAPVDPAHRP